jgi:hypothetical protein
MENGNGNGILKHGNGILKHGNVSGNSIFQHPYFRVLG